MTAVHSARWYRVAGLKPRLSAQLQLRRQRVRGQTWYLLADPVRGRSVRLNAAAYAIAARLDGQHTVQQLWDRSLQHAHEAATQDVGQRDDGPADDVDHLQLFLQVAVDPRPRRAEAGARHPQPDAELTGRRPRIGLRRAASPDAAPRAGRRSGRRRRLAASSGALKRPAGAVACGEFR